MDTVTTTTTHDDLVRRQTNGNAEVDIQIQSGGLHHSDNVDVARDDTVCVNHLTPAAIDKSRLDEVK